MNSNTWTELEQLPVNQFLHGINPHNFLACWNLTLSPRLASPDYAAMYDAGLRQQHVPIRDFPLESIAQGGMPPGVVTPRTATFLVVASIDRKGMRAGKGALDTKWLSAEDQARRRAIDDIEVAFEQQRRLLYPEAASRYGCLWLAENSDHGRTHIMTMLPNSHIMRTHVVGLLRITKCDTAWFEAYVEQSKPESISGYWSGVPMHDNNPNWEYLLEGAVEFEQADIDELCLTAMSLGAWPSSVEIPERIRRAAHRSMQ